MHQRDAAAAAGAADVDRTIIDSVMPFAETKRILLFYTLPAKGWYRKGVCDFTVVRRQGRELPSIFALALAFIISCSYLYVRT